MIKIRYLDPDEHIYFYRTFMRYKWFNDFIVKRNITEYERVETLNKQFGIRCSYVDCGAVSPIEQWYMKFIDSNEHLQRGVYIYCPICEHAKNTPTVLLVTNGYKIEEIEA